MAAASDEPSENQTKQKMHRDMKHSTVTRMERRTWYITQKNSLKKDGRETLFIGDQPYLVKTDRNDIAYSSFDKKFSRVLHNDSF